MISFDKVVLGGGITGMMIGSCNDFPVIYDKISIPPVPFYLHDTPEVAKLIERFMPGEIRSRKLSVGYADHCDLLVEPTQAMVDDYSYKKKRDPYTPREYSILDVDIHNFYERMITNATLCRDTIVSIDTKNRVLTGKNNRYKYVELISTIPAPAFMRMAGIKADCPFIPIRRIEIEDVPYNNPAFRWFDYTYFMDKSPLLRYTPTKNGRGYVEILSSNYNQVGILSRELPLVPDVWFAGRFARWEEDRFFHNDVKAWS